jgi:hypothetical protein
MAGTIVADFIRTDANQLSLNVGNTTFATINAMGFLSNTGVQIISPTGAINAASIAAGSIPAGKLGAASVARTNMYSGAVLQVVSAFKNDTFSAASGSYVDITGLSVSITPTSSSSKILIIVTIGCQGNDGNAANAFRLLRGSTVIAQPDVGTADSRDGFFTFYHGNTTSIGVGASLNYLDSPATTSSTTYKVSGYSNAATFYINRLPGDSTWQSVSNITLMEIAA